jgi:hypothetical protein
MRVLHLFLLPTTTLALFQQHNLSNLNNTYSDTVGGFFDSFAGHLSHEDVLEHLETDILKEMGSIIGSTKQNHSRPIPLPHPEIMIVPVDLILPHVPEKPRPGHHSETPPGKKHSGLSYHGLPTSTPANRRLSAFFKLAHSRVDRHNDIKALATGLFPLYVQLCAARGNDCDSVVGEMFRARYNELQLELDIMDRLQLVLSRLMRTKGRWGKKKPAPKQMLRRWFRRDGRYYYDED